MVCLVNTKAVQVLPSLLEVCPEARLNLAVHYLRQGQLQEAFKLIKDMQPATPQEYTLKGKPAHLLIQSIPNTLYLSTSGHPLDEGQLQLAVNVLGRFAVLAWSWS